MFLRKLYPLFCFGIVVLLAACGGGGGDSAGGGDSGGGGGGGGGAATVVDPATAGSVSGSIAFTGSAPEPELIDMGGEPDCASAYTEGPFAQTVEVNDNGTLADVFVYVKSGLEGMNFPAPSEPVVLDQHNCRYTPHVLGVQTDQPVLIRNSDDLLHNIHPVPENSRGFNVGQPNQGMETERSFSAAEIMIPVGCDVHGWMEAYIGVVDHPYFAVTGSDGSFELPNLPPGEYTIEVWHQEFGTQEMKVTVGEGETATADFSFSG
ncbi:MAG TPA: carboxypeptidase regulatory-like domain-containing protein [Anaerolineae bacterium]|jgi:hypothetical protein